MENTIFLEKTYSEVRALGVVSNQLDFSLLCGRTGTWFSCIKARNLPMTSDAVLTLSHNLSVRAQSLADAKTQSDVITLSEQLLQQAQLQISSKIRRLSGCPS